MRLTIDPIFGLESVDKTARGTESAYLTHFELIYNHIERSL